jgi:hypothetical protein
MRGSDKRSGELFSYVNLDDRIRRDHPLRAILGIANAALAALSGDFAALYSGMGRPSIATEMLLQAMLLQAFYSCQRAPNFPDYGLLKFPMLAADMAVVSHIGGRFGVSLAAVRAVSAGAVALRAGWRGGFRG